MHERTWHITIGLLVAIVGFVIAASTLNTAGRYIACFIFPMGAYSVNSVIIGWASSTLSQTKEKKAVSYFHLNSLQMMTNHIRLSWH
jgi:multisubunit Na+/H+ antiporter MnhG subunit